MYLLIIPALLLFMTAILVFYFYLFTENLSVFIYEYFPFIIIDDQVKNLLHHRMLMPG